MDRASKILDIAERRMRQTGYNAVSYRDIAAEIGIKSASLHYHFPKKEVLGVALVRRYASNFRKALIKRTAVSQSPQESIEGFAELYNIELKQNHLVCLCAVLGAEAPGLPEAVTLEVRAFFEFNIAWLTKNYEKLGKLNPTQHAKVTLSLLEGAMIVSSVNDDNSIFDAAVNLIASELRPSYIKA